MSLGRQPPPKPIPARRNFFPMRSSCPMASASFTTSPSAASHTSAIALMKEILVARKEFAEVFTSSAVGKSVTTNGEPSATGPAYTSRRSFSAPSLAIPTTIRSGCRVSCTAKPSRRNSGFQASSAPAAGRSQLGEAGRETGGGAHRDGRLADDQDGPVQVRGQGIEGAVDVAHVAGVLAVLLRSVHTDEVDVAELADLLPGGGEAQPAGGSLDPGDVPLEHLLQARFVHRHTAGGEQLDLLRDDIEPQDLEAQLGHGRGMGGAEIAGADHSDPEGHGVLLEDTDGRADRA